MLHFIPTTLAAAHLALLQASSNTQLDTLLVCLRIGIFWTAGNTLKMKPVEIAAKYFSGTEVLCVVTVCLNSERTLNLCVSVVIIVFDLIILLYLAVKDSRSKDIELQKLKLTLSQQENLIHMLINENELN